MKRDFVFVLIGVLMLIFAAFTLFAILMPKNAVVIRNKIKLGLLIVSLQAFVSGCGSPEIKNPPPDCYIKQATPDMLNLMVGEYKEGTYFLQWSQGDSLIFTVDNRQSEAYYYEILDVNRKVVNEGILKNVHPEADNELFAVPKINLIPGSYHLLIFNVDPQKEGSDASPLETLELMISPDGKKAEVTPSTGKPKGGIIAEQDTIERGPDPGTIRCYLPPHDMDENL